jgi:hypothetical protein
VQASHSFDPLIAGIQLIPVESYFIHEENVIFSLANVVHQLSALVVAGTFGQDIHVLHANAKRKGGVLLWFVTKDLGVVVDNAAVIDDMTLEQFLQDEVLLLFLFSPWSQDCIFALSTAFCFF